jgi:hypothetical protein
METSLTSAFAHVCARALAASTRNLTRVGSRYDNILKQRRAMLIIKKYVRSTITWNQKETKGRMPFLAS